MYLNDASTDAKSILSPGTKSGGAPRKMCSFGPKTVSLSKTTLEPIQKEQTKGKSSYTSPVARLPCVKEFFGAL